MHGRDDGMHVPFERDREQRRGEFVHEFVRQQRVVSLEGREFLEERGVLVRATVQFVEFPGPDVECVVELLSASRVDGVVVGLLHHEGRQAHVPAEVVVGVQHWLDVPEGVHDFDVGRDAEEYCHRDAYRRGCVGEKREGRQQFVDAVRDAEEEPRGSGDAQSARAFACPARQGRQQGVHLFIPIPILPTYLPTYRTLFSTRACVYARGGWLMTQANQ